MQRYMLVAAVAALASCGGSPTTPGGAPLPATPASAAITRLSISARCAGPFHPGEYVPLACYVEVFVPPSVQSYAVHADRSALGGGADSPVAQCPACGAQPWTYDLDIRVPSDVTPGVKPVPVWVVDNAGNRADATASIEIAR